MNEQGVYDTDYAGPGYFLEKFNSGESGIEDLAYNDGELYAGGYISKMVAGNVFDFSFVKLIYNPSLTVDEVNQIQFTMYPNPASDVIKIELLDTETYAFQIYNVAGKLISQRKLISNSFELNVSSIPKGIYFISITSLSTGVAQSRKVIVE
jgi:hypothetical protein